MGCVGYRDDLCPGRANRLMPHVDGAADTLQAKAVTRRNGNAVSTYFGIDASHTMIE